MDMQNAFSKPQNSNYPYIGMQYSNFFFLHIASSRIEILFLFLFYFSLSLSLSLSLSHTHTHTHTHYGLDQEITLGHGGNNGEA